MRLHTKVLLVVIPLTVVPLLVLGTLAYQQLYATGAERTYAQMTTLMDQLDRGFKVRTLVAEANSRLFAEAPLMRSYALTDDEEERYVLMLPSLLKLFNSYLRAYPEYYEIRFLLPDGFEDARATLHAMANASEDEADTPYFRALSAFSGETYSRVMTNPDNGEISLQVARALRLINAATDDPLSTVPRLRGYLVITVDLEPFAQQIVSNRIGDRGHTMVVDRQGKILFHHDPSRLGADLPRSLMHLVESVSENREYRRAYYQGAGVYFSARRIHPDLLLVGALPESELLGGSRDLGRTTTWITAATLFLVIVALLLAMNRLMVRPLNSSRLARR